MNPLVLVILDGFGYRQKRAANAVSLAKTPNFDRLLKNYPHTTLDASGEAVGLPPGTMGNSEVGHLTIGSGRVLYQDLSQIHRSIGDGSFFQNPVLKKAFKTAQKNQSTVHLIGLLSDAGVHSHQKHLFALLKMAKKYLPLPLRERVGVRGRIAIHCFLDGRDTPPKSSRKYVKKLQKELGKEGAIATLVGRYYAMDRDKRWERVRIAYEAMVEGKGHAHNDPVWAIEEAYAQHLTDEFIQPFVFGGDTALPQKPPSENLLSDRSLRPAERAKPDSTGTHSLIKDGDVVIFFNFRPDRARELTQALTDPNFTGFQRKVFPQLGMFVCFTEYDKNFDLPVAFPKNKPTRILAEILSEKGISQFHVAETEKYAHVTYFLNGGVEKPFPGEERLLIPSPKNVPTYDKKPQMSAARVTKTALLKIREGCPVVIMNYANPDMVGHSGVLPATIQAVEVIDDCLGKICKKVLARKGAVVITADHGNCEEMADAQGGPHTAHTTNPVPFLLVSDSFKNRKLRSGGGLQDVAPTILDILGIPKPSEMTGSSLMVKS